MNDYWNDPPEGPEPPECPNEQCKDGSGEYLYDGKTGHVFSCDKCGYQWVIPFQQVEEIPQDEERLPEPDSEEPKPCAHGIIGVCEACDRLSDFLYDANRESRK